MLRGKVETKVGGKQSTLPAGEMMFVPASVPHEFWNPYDEPGEMILLMFGEGA
jgi:mannose-6-phosphate isomerase-like protein (cupin superfamily)